MSLIVAALVKVATTVWPSIMAATGYSVAAAATFGAAVVLSGVAAMNYGMRKIMAQDFAMSQGDAGRDVTTRSTISPQTIVYGQALVSGPVFWIGVAGTNNRDLYTGIALAGHECMNICDVYFDDEQIEDDDINGGAAAGGNVTAGTFAPIEGVTIAKINKHLGTSTQTVDSDLDAAFTEIDSTWRGRGICYVVTKLTLTADAQEFWDKHGAPTNVRCSVKGKKCYDPRLEVAAGGTAGASPTNGSYIAYTTNPSVIVCDYLRDTTYGLGILPAKIDWTSVITAATACDTSVDVPGGVEKRFTCNGVLYMTETHRVNLDRLLSSMNGWIVYAAGLYYVNAGIYTAPALTLNEDNLIGPIGLKTSFERDDRFNQVGGVFVNPDANFKLTDFHTVTDSAAVTRDNDETLLREITLPFTNTNYMAQRIAYKLTQQTDLQKTLTFPCNMAGLNIKPGDRVSVTLAELGWTSKIFRVIAWAFSDAGDQVGVNLTLREDDSTKYADMAEGDYSTVTPDGTITAGFPGVDAPSALTATAVIEGIELDWTNPTNMEQFNAVAIYASETNAWGHASRVEIGRGMMTSFVHNQSTAADPIEAGDSRYYWVRALRYGTGTDTGAVSDRFPDSDTSTITATARSGYSTTTATGSATAGGTASATITRYDPGQTSITVDWQISGGSGTATNPFPSTLTIKRGTTTVKTYANIAGDYTVGSGGDPNIAFGNFNANFVDTDTTELGSRTYNLTSSTSSAYAYTEALEIEVTQTQG